MVNKKWTVDDQEQFLVGSIPKFCEHKAKGTLTLFWDKFLREWFSKYPVENAHFHSHPEYDIGTVEEIRAKKMAPMRARLREWFNGRLKVKPTATGGQEVLDLSGKKPRLLQIHHAYIHLYYDDRVAHVHESEYAQHVNEVTENGGKPMAEVTFRDRVAARLFSNETDDVKARCETYRRMLQEKGLDAKAARLAGLAVGMRGIDDAIIDETETREPNPTDTAEAERLAAAAEIQKNINALPGTLACIVRTLFEKTGWRALIMVGGPEPEKGGKLESFHISTETAEDKGQDFQSFHKNWSEDVEGVFVDWLVNKFPQDQRSKVSLRPSTRTPANDVSSTHVDNETAAAPTADSVPSVSSATTGPNPQLVATPTPTLPVVSPSMHPSTESTDLSTTQVIPPPPSSASTDASTVASNSVGDATLVDDDDSQSDDLGELGGLLDDAVQDKDDLPTDPPTLGAAAGNNAPSTAATAVSVSGRSTRRGKNEQARQSRQHTKSTARSQPQSKTKRTEVAASPASQENDGLANAPIACRPSPPNPTKEKWHTDSHQFLDTNLTFHGAVDVVNTWLIAEDLLSPYVVNKTKLPLDKRPDGIEWWYKNGRNFAKQPPVKLFPQFCPLDWYIELNPTWRGESWPLVKDEAKKKDEDWGKLANGGKSGIVMLLVSVTWWAMRVNTVDERRLVVKVLADIKWVLDAIVERLKAKETGDVSGSKANPKPRMKRGAGSADFPVPTQRAKRTRTN